jgi:hypothetical protein
MAGISARTLRRLLPDGTAFRDGANLLAVAEALGLSMDRAHDFLGGVSAESIPETADATIDQWLDALGLSVPAGSSLGDKRKIASAVYAAIGGQSLDYLNAQVSAAFPNVQIIETASTTDYRVVGFLPFARDFLRLAALLTRLAPLHLEAIFQVRSVYDGDVARCGIGTVGRKIVGRRETAYTETQGEIARCGQGRVGMEIIGRTA